jgi:undecaprenyl-diphosphatase
MELKILDFIQTLRTPVGDAVIPYITRLGDAGVIWVLLTVVFLCLPKKRKTGCILFAALLIDVILCNGILKPLAARVRPFDVNTTVQLLVSRPKDYSFPSGHTAASFASVTALFLAGERRLWKIALVVAVAIAFSRLYLYVHYPTDVLGGMVAGIVAGYLGNWVIKKCNKKWK